MNSNIAIITARGGSKRIPGKNIRAFLGKPIIQYSIEAALQSGCFNEVMVSTDDLDIAHIARSCGASVPFMRSKANADDHSTTADALLEVLQTYKQLGKEFEYACCLYPTAPFVTAQKLKDAFELLKQSNALSVVPVVRYSFPIYRSLKMENGYLHLNWPEYLNTRSQDLPPAFHDAGQFYFFRTAGFLTEQRIFTEQTLGFEIAESEVQDIDTEEDWKIAEMKYTILQQKQKRNT